MQKIVAALALSGASALVAPAAPRATVKVQETKADLERLCAENPTALPFEGIWDPLGCADFNFWGLGNEATIGYLRHAEIKHGRVAMAAFLGFIVQSLPVVSGEHWFAPYRGYVAGVSPQEQWDNVPAIGKLQILVAIGMLESYGEGAGNPEGYVHYCNGPRAGVFFFAYRDAVDVPPPRRQCLTSSFSRRRPPRLLPADRRPRRLRPGWLQPLRPLQLVRQRVPGEGQGPRAPG